MINKKIIKNFNQLIKKMSSDQKFLTEVDKMIVKLDEIIISIKGKEGAIDYKSVKDGFDRLRFKINENLKEVETLLNERDKILTSTVPKEIYERKSIETKLENLLDEIDKKLKDLNIELKAIKNKTGKYGDYSNKEKMKGLMEQKYQLFRSKLDGMEIEEKEIQDNRSSIEQLEDIIQKQEGGGAPQQERELYEEERAKMQEWKEEQERQNEDLEDIHDMVKKLGNEVRTASKNIDKTHSSVKKLTKNVEKSTAKVDSQNKKLKDLIGKLRSGDKLCLDLVLILIALGLIAVLYNVIKRKIFS